VKLFARRIHKNAGTESLTQGEVYANLAKKKYEVGTDQIGKPNTNGRMIVGS